MHTGCPKKNALSESSKLTSMACRLQAASCQLAAFDSESEFFLGHPVDPSWSSPPYIIKVRWESSRERKWLWLSLFYAPPPPPPPPSPITNYHYHRWKITKERRAANREGKRPSLLPMSQKLCALSGQTAKKRVWFMSSRSNREVVKNVKGRGGLPHSALTVCKFSIEMKFDSLILKIYITSL